MAGIADKFETHTRVEFYSWPLLTNAFSFKRETVGAQRRNDKIK